MGNPYIGEIRMFAGNFAPAGWAFCDGQPIPISENDALFVLIGTTYGGDGQETFALPNLQSRTPVGFGPSADPNWNPSAYQWGETGGVENVTLLSQQLPAHNHVGNATTAAGAARNPSGALYGTTTNAIYAAPNGRVVPLAAPTVTYVGGNQSHSNIQPYETINYNIAMTGIFPSRS